MKEISLSDSKVFYVRENHFKGKRMIEARVYYLTKNGWKPTKQGLTLYPDVWQDLITHIYKALDMYYQVKDTTFIGETEYNQIQKYWVRINMFKGKKTIDIRKVIHDFATCKDELTKSGFRGSPEFIHQIVKEVTKLINH
jgi:hypothetical protein